ncbi:LIM domain protein [Cooperia oncophora]
MDRAADRRLCGQCHTSIGDEAVVAMNRLWHPDHFTCTACKRPIKSYLASQVQSQHSAFCSHFSITFVN